MAHDARNCICYDLQFVHCAVDVAPATSAAAAAAAAAAVATPCATAISADYCC